MPSRVITESRVEKHGEDIPIQVLGGLKASLANLGISEIVYEAEPLRDNITGLVRLLETQTERVSDDIVDKDLSLSEGTEDHEAGERVLPYTQQFEVLGLEEPFADSEGSTLQIARAEPYGTQGIAFGKTLPPMTNPVRTEDHYGSRFLPNLAETDPRVNYSGAICGCCGKSALICDKCGCPKRGLMKTDGVHTCKTCEEPYESKECLQCSKLYSIRFPGPYCRSCRRHRPKI